MNANRVTPNDVREAISCRLEELDEPPGLRTYTFDLSQPPPRTTPLQRLERLLRAADTDAAELVTSRASYHSAYRLMKRWISATVGWDAPEGDVEQPEECYRLVLQYVIDALERSVPDDDER